MITADSVAAMTATSNSFPFSPLVSVLEARLYEDIGFAPKLVRVIHSTIGGIIRMCAPELDITAEGRTLQEARGDFFGQITLRPDAASLMFDIGPTRPQEIARGLDAPEDEDWSGLISDIKD